MKISECAIGDYVQSQALGAETIIDFVKDVYGRKFALIVEFEKTPPLEYNMGNNPAMIFPTTLEKLEL